MNLILFLEKSSDTNVLSGSRIVVAVGACFSTCTTWMALSCHYMLKKYIFLM